MQNTVSYGQKTAKRKMLINNHRLRLYSRYKILFNLTLYDLGIKLTIFLLIFYHMIKIWLQFNPISCLISYVFFIRILNLNSAYLFHWFSHEILSKYLKETYRPILYQSSYCITTKSFLVYIHFFSLQKVFKKLLKPEVMVKIYYNLL